MTERATLLCESSDSLDCGNVAKLLGFFGISGDRATIAEFVARIAYDGTKTAILGEPRAFLSLLDVLERREDGLRIWQETISSVFVYAGTDTVSFQTLARTLTGDPKVSVSRPTSGTEWTVSSEVPDFAKSMGGVRVTTPDQANGTALAFERLPRGATDIVSSRSGSALLKIEYRTVPVYLSTATNIIDIDAGLVGRNFDIRQHFLTAAPVTMYLKWAFARTCWQPAETRACLVIDDPLLKPRYGFLHFETFLDLMRRHNFATSIAFIPWNWRRSAAKVIRLFAESEGRFSLSIHGCDHTGGEFGSQNIGRLAWKSDQATARMARHESRTGVRHDRVMVFPQGVFSEAAMGVLKRGNFVGVVNSEVISTDPQPRTVTVADFWDVAVMKYGNFPIFTRRYPSDGIENFAFDILLGKPCLVVIHHNDCHDRCRQLVAFIDRLNTLNARLSWGNLTEVVQNSFRQREAVLGTVEIDMYGAELRVSNPSAQRKTFRISRRELEPSLIKEICADARPIPWEIAADRVAFQIELVPGERKIIRVDFCALPQGSFKGENRIYRAKAMVRRFLSEFRDNYFTRRRFSA